MAVDLTITGTAPIVLANLLQQTARNHLEDVNQTIIGIQTTVSAYLKLPPQTQDQMKSLQTVRSQLMDVHPIIIGTLDLAPVKFMK